MSKHEAKTVPRQAERLCRQPIVDSAAFILWGHNIEDGFDLDPKALFGATASGWAKWTCEEKRTFPAFYRGPGECCIWLWSTEKEAPSAPSGLVSAQTG